MSAIAQQNSRFSPIMRLPTELLDATLSMVPPEDIETSSLVSHQWRRASLRYVFSEVTIDLTDDARNFAACNEFIKKQVATKEDIAPFIKVLKVGGIFFNKPVLDVDVLLKTVERLPCLRSLELEHVSIVVSTPSSSIQGLNRHRDIHSVTMRGVKTLNESPYEGVISVLCSFSRISSLEFIGFEDKLGKMKGSEHAEVPLWSGPGPAVSRLVITHHLPLAVFLPILAPASGSTLSHLEISCRSLTDLKAAGDFLRDTGTNLVSLILDIWRLNMVKNERYLITPQLLVSALRDGLDSCKKIQYFSFRSGAMFAPQGNPRNVEVYSAFFKILAALPPENLRHFTVDFDDTHCARVPSNEGLINPWMCNAVDWSLFRRICRKFKVLEAIELLYEQNWMEEWDEEETDRVIGELQELKGKDIIMEMRRTCHCGGDDSCVHIRL